MLAKGKKHVISFLVVAAMLHVLASCGSSGLPPEAKKALDESIAHLAGTTKANYRIASAQKAPGAPEEQRIAPQLPSSSGVSGCPPDSGDRETWCIVIDPEIVGRTGQGYSHFLLTRIGDSWYVEDLTDAEANRFEYIGCTNWNVRH